MEANDSIRGGKLFHNMTLGLKVEEKSFLKCLGKFSLVSN